MSRADLSTLHEVLFSFSVLGLIPPLILLVRCIRSCVIISQVRKVLKSLRAVVRNWKEEDDEVRKHVNETILQEKAETYRKIAAFMCVAHAPLLLTMMASIKEKGGARREAWALDFNVIFQQAAVGLVALRPSTLTPSNMDAFYSFGMLGNALIMNPWTCSPEALVPIALVINSVSIVLIGVGTRRTSVTLLLNLIFALCASSTIWVHGKSCFVRPALLALAQLGIVALCTFVSRYVEMKTKAFLYSSLQFKEAQEHHSAASALLRTCCEVVVELDPGGLIMTPARELSSFLLRGTQSLQGTKLVDLLVEDSREEFSRRLETPRLSHVGLAETAPATMRDGDGSLLHLELLWVEFTRLNGGRHYLLGVREMTEKPPDPSVSGVADTVFSDTVTTAVNSFTLPETSSVSTGPFDSQPAMAYVDCLEPGYPISRLTDEFCVRIGRPPIGTQMIQVVEKSKQFSKWMERCIRAWEEDEDPPRDLKVHLRMPQGSMKARCRMVKAPEGDTKCVVTDMEQVCLLFYNIRHEGNRSEAAPRAFPSMKGTPRSVSMGMQTGANQTQKKFIMHL